MRYRLVFVGSLLVLALALLGLALYIQNTQSSKQGLTCTISCPRREFKQGDEIPITFKIRNTGKSPVPFLSRWFVRSGRWDEYQLVARRQDGTVVVDPRTTWVGFGGGPGLETTIESGDSFSETFVLNEWALISEPGRYTVVGIFTNNVYADREDQIVVHSKPIKIVIKSRTYEEMGRYINDLIEKLKVAKENKGKYSIINKLMFTRDSRIVPTLLDYEYTQNGEGWAHEAFMYYLPLEEETKNIILDRANKCGLVDSTFEALKRFGCTNEQLKELIKISLASDNPRCITTGAKAAQRYPDDSHIAKLIELARSSKNSIQREVIRALARNRTEEGVETLKELLEDPNERVRDYTFDAIKRSYQISQIYSKQHEPTVYSEFGSTSEIIDMAADPNHPKRWEAVSELVWRIDKEKVEAFKYLIGGRDRDIPEAIADKGNMTIISLLRDPHKDVRDTTATIIRLFHRMQPGRPLKENDFPELFREIIEKREAWKKRVLEEPNSE